MRYEDARGCLGGWLLAGLALLGGCGGREPEATGVNRTTWQSVYQGALDALGRRDLDGLMVLLSPVGRVSLEQDLQGFCGLLAHPTEGPRLMLKVRQRWPDVPAELVEGARAGRLRDAWTLFMTAGTPAGVLPRQAGLRVDPERPDEAMAFYRYGDGAELPIAFKRVKGVWAIERLTLGSS